VIEDVPDTNNKEKCKIIKKLFIGHVLIIEKKRIFIKKLFLL